MKVGSGPGALRDSGTFRTKREADEWAVRRRAELKAQKNGNEGHKKTLRDAMRRYAEEVAPTHRGERWEQIRLAAFEGHDTLPITLPVGQITPQHLARWRQWRETKVGPASVRREMSLLGSVFTAARRDWHWIDASPLQDVRRPAAPPHSERTITKAEIKVMLRELGYRWGRRPASVKQVVAYTLLLALRTGMRAGELAGMSWENVHDSWVRLPLTKNGSARDVPLSIKAHGRHMIANAVAALAVAEEIGVNRDTALSALAQFGAPEGRGQATLLGPATRPLLLVDESYNANSASMAAAMDVFAAQDVRDFVSAGALTPTAAGSRLIELYTLSVGDTIVATMGGVCADGRFSAMFSSIIHDRFKTESPGEQLLVRVVRDCCERGLHTFDLGVGEANYKSMFCDPDPMFDSDWPLTAKGRAFALMHRGFAAAKRAVKQNPALWNVIVAARRIKARLTNNSKSEAA